MFQSAIILITLKGNKNIIMNNKKNLNSMVVKQELSQIIFEHKQVFFFFVNQGNIKDRFIWT